MTRAMCAAIVVCALALSAVAANATPRHQKQARQTAQGVNQCVYDNTARIVCPGSAGRIQRVPMASGDGVIGRRPPGCPRRFCGCEASLYLFGRIDPFLNLASNWLRKFPRANPAPGMAAARPGHVFVLVSHVDGTDWLVHDGNSGGGLTRRHVRSIAGYRIVDPNGNRMASR